MHHGKARNSVSPGDGLLVKYPRLPPIVPVDEQTDSKFTTIIVMRGSRAFFRGFGFEGDIYNVSLLRGVLGTCFVILIM